MCKQAITITVTNAKIESGTLGTQRKYLFGCPVIGAPSCSKNHVRRPVELTVKVMYVRTGRQWRR